MMGRDINAMAAMLVVCLTVMCQANSLFMSDEPTEYSNKVDLAIVYHLSNKIRPQDINKYFIPFLIATVEKANIDNGNVRIALVNYARKARTVFNLSKIKTSAEVIQKLSDIDSKDRARRSSGGSALNEVRTEIFTKAAGDRDNIPNAILLITDAKTSDDQESFLQEAEALKAQGVKIVTVGIESADSAELRTIASHPADENAVISKSYTSVASQDIIDFIYKAIPALQEVPPAMQTVRQEETTEAARLTLDLRGVERADVVFAIHFEPTRSGQDFETLKSFIWSIIETADVDGGRVRFSVYFDGRGTAFSLNAYSTNDALYRAVSQFSKNDLKTQKFDLVETLSKIRTEIFQPQNGDREGVSNAVILITDTNSGQDIRQINEEKSRLAQEGIAVYSFGIGLRDKTEIENIAFSTNNVFSFSDYRDLQQYGSAFKNEIGALNTRQVPAELERPLKPELSVEEVTQLNSCGRTDLVFVLDASTSVTQKNFELMKDFVKDFLSHADIDSGNVRVGINIYSTGVYVQFQLSTYKTKLDVYSAIDKIPYRAGSTNTADALKTMRTEMFTQANGDRPGVENVAIVVTDGISNINSKRTIPEAEQAHADGIKIFAIGIGLTDTKELDGIASKPVEKNQFIVQEFSELRNIRENIYAVLCQESALTLVVTEPPFITREPQPTVTEASEHRVSCGRTDLVFVLDASTSVTQKNFELMKDFVKDFLSHADIDSGNVRVGINIYSTGVYVQFQLSTYKTKLDVYSAIDKIPYRAGSTNTADALKTMRTEMFTQANGDRPGVKNVAIVMTDGISNINSKRTIPEAEQAHADGIQIFAIGIGLKDTKELDGIASKPVEKNQFIVQEFSELRNITHNVYTAFCGEDFTVPVPTGYSETGTDLVFMLDTFVDNHTFEWMKTFVKDFVLQLDIDSGQWRVGGLTFGSRANTEFSLNTYNFQDEVTSAVDRLRNAPSSRHPDVAEAFDYVRVNMFTSSQGDRTRARNFVVLLTGSDRSEDRELSYAAARRLKDTDTGIFTLGFNFSDSTELDEISSEPLDDYRMLAHDVNNLREIPGIFKYQIDRAESLTQQLTTITTTVTARRIPKYSETGTDLVFMLDSSAGDLIFEWMIVFVKDFVSQLDIDSGQWRVGGLTFDSRVRADFHLNRYNFQDEIINAVDRLRNQRTGGNPDVAGAFDYVRQNMFTSMNGDRNQARNFVILLTGNEKSLNREQSYAAANRLKDTGTGIYTLGLNFRDSTELDEISSKPLDDHRTLVYSINNLREIPGIYKYRIDTESAERLTQRPTTWITSTATTARSTASRRIPKLSETGTDVVFILDSSVDSRIFEWMKSFVKDFVLQLDIDSGQWRVGGLTFDSRARADFHLNRYNFQDEVINAVDRLRIQRISGRPDVARAFDYVRQNMFTSTNGDRTQARNFVVLLTGNDRSLNRGQSYAAANRLKATGTGIYTLGLNFSDSTELDEISSKPLDDYRTLIRNENELKEIPGIYKYRIDTVSAERVPDLPATQPLTVITTTVGTTTARRIPKYSETGTDLVFMLDSSVDDRIFEWMKNFVKDFLLQLDIDSGQWRVGGLTFDSTARADFHLNRYNFQDEVINAVDRLRNQRTSGNPDVAGAFDYVRQNMFTSTNGDRTQARNFVILLTGSARSLNREQSYAAANRLKDTGTGIYTLGLNFRDSTELDEISSKPLDDYRTLIRGENELREIPGIYKYRIDTVSAERVTQRATTQLYTTPAASIITSRRVPKYSETGTDLVFMLDSSVDDRIFEWMKNFVKDFVLQLDIDSGQWRVGGLTFDSRARADFHLNRYDFQDEVINAVDRLRNQRTSGNPDVAGAFDYVRQNMFTSTNGDRTQARNFVILLSGNARSLNREQSYAAANRLKDAGTGIYTLGLNFRDSTELDEISSKPLDDYRTLIRGENELREIPGIYKYRIDTVSAERVTQRATTQLSTTTATVRTTTPRRIPKYSETGTDLVFMLDSSVDDGIFEWMKNFVKDFVLQLDIDSGQWRVGGLTFDSRARADFHLNRYNFQDEVISAVDRLRNQRISGRPDVAGAFDYVRQNMFTSTNGDRTQARNFVVLLTGNDRSLNREQSYAAANRLKDAGTGVYTLGLNFRDSTELDEISSKPLDDYRTLISSEVELREIPGIYRYRIGRASAERVTQRPTTVLTTTTTTARPTTPRRIPKYSQTGTDLVFMLDSSVDNRIFEWMKMFVKDFALQLDIDSGQWRVGGLTFDSRARADFHLNRYNFQDEIVRAVDNLRNQRTNGRPDVAAAFDYVRRNMFTSSAGDRSGARNFVILLSGNARSLNSEQSYAAANRLKNVGTGIYTLGLNFRDSTELDEISSKPLEDYRTLISSEDELREIPGIYKYRIDTAPALTPRSTTPLVPVARLTRRPSTRVIQPLQGDCRAKGDIIFVLDSSGSVGEDNFNLVKNFTYSVIRDLEIDNGFFRVGVITFSDSSRIEFQLNTYITKQEIFEALEKIQYVYGHTHTAEALRRVRTEMLTSARGDRLDVPNLLVVVTDGESNINHLDTLPEARQIKSTGATIVTVAIGLDENLELRGLTSPPVEENLIEVSDFDDLRRLSHIIVTPLCSDTNLCDGNPCKNGGQCVDGLRSYMCICMAGFYGENCDKSCGPPADVVLILDSSSSIGAASFDAIKTYAQTLVRQMNVLSCGIHIGIIKYSSAAMIQFSLGYYTEDRILNAIQAISYTPGRSNMAEALKVVRTQMFTNRNGDRPNAHNIAFLLTDGSVEINRDITASEVDLMIDAGVHVIPLAVDLKDRTEIEYIAESQGNSLIEIENQDSFVAMSDQVLEAVYDTEDRCSINPCLNGAECVNVPRGFTCICTEGFVGDTCDRASNGDADIVFAVDASRYNSAHEFRATKRFLWKVIKRMPFREGGLRIAIVEYGATPRLRLSLLDGENKETVKSAVGSLRMQNGDPSLENAVRLVDYNVFHRSGDRKEAPNYLVVVTRSIGSVNAVHAINDIKSKGTKVLGVGVNLSSRDQKYLEESVSFPRNQTLFLVDAVDYLDRRSTDFAYFDRYIFEERNLCARNPCQNGGSCENGETTFVCYCPLGYAGIDCSRTCEDKADVVFLIDSSGSVGFDNFQQIKAFVQHVINSLNIGPEATRVGIATFSQDSKAEIYLDSFEDKSRLLSAVSGITYEYGHTNTASGIRLVRSSLFSEAKGNRPDVPDYLILITDGLSNINPETTIPEAEYAHDQGIHIFAIGVGIADPWELNGVASKPSNRNVFQISTWDGLRSISDELIDRTCRDSEVCAEKPCRNGGTCVAGVGTFSCQCQAGYVGDACDVDCQSEKDIAFIVDASASVGPANFELVLKYVSAIIRSLTAYGQEHHFSLITYSTDVKTVFSFNRYSSAEQILEVVQTVTYSPGSTNTAGGLRQAIQVFQSDFGDRPSAQNVAVLITDGQSNVNYWDTIPAADDLKSAGVKVITVGINLQNFDEISSIASSNRDSFTVSSFRSLEEVELSVIGRLCLETE